MAMHTACTAPDTENHPNLAPKPHDPYLRSVISTT